MERWATTLREAESEVLASLPGPVYLIDDDWKLLFISDEGAALLGRPVESLVGHSMWDNYPDLRGTIVERELMRARDEQVAVEFVNHYEPLGIWFAIQARPFRKGLLIAYHDVSGLKRAKRELADLAAEQGALARIAKAVAGREPPARLFERVAEEVAQLQGVEGGTVVQLTGPGRARVVGMSREHPPSVLAVDEDTPDRGVFDELRRTGEPVLVRAGAGPLADEMEAAGRVAWLQVPIFVEARLWGVLGLASLREDVLDEQAIVRQRDFAELLSVAIGNADAHDRLARMAATDSVTGLANHRAFHARLRDDAGAASRIGGQLAVAVFDLDRFRDVNDLHGHLAGDAILSQVAERLARHVTAGQLLARIGGDEFALIMPGWSAAEARPLIETVCAEISAAPYGAAGSELTMSAGLADLAAAGHGELLFACADGALYWSKLNGRDVVCTFEPSIVNELSPTDRAETLLRRKTLAGITALARAIDAKDPTTSQHSERVARLVEQLARACGWEERRIRLLREAALVHDVGKIGIPDAILLQTGVLSDEQYEAVKRHAMLGAEIVDGVLTPEQVQWVRSHHERPDGDGYPDGVRAAQITSGGALLSIADALDVMTISRPYSRPLPLARAIEECERLVGTQFMPEAAIALRTLHRRGALEEWDLA